MSNATYHGVFSQRQSLSLDRGRCLDDLAARGFTVVQNMLPDAVLEEARSRLDRHLERQQREFGAERLALIGEENLVRCPLATDDFFLELAANDAVVDLAHSAIGGGYVLLHLQNGIIIKPEVRHRQSAWHRDLPYQEFTSSRPLAISAIYCIDSFAVETGCTHVLPHSHRIAQPPGDQDVTSFEVPVFADAGSVVLFDSMLFHRAGSNTSGSIRRAINHVYTIPLIRQQIDLPQQLGDRIGSDAGRRKLFGFDCKTAHSVREYREFRLERALVAPTCAK
jgi:ectoine hydroxylase-related dioxygenase (phytanoyl-CoA dioxygenase family)